MKKLSSKTVHQYLPLDTPLFNARFLKHWKPTHAIFVESEIWPNLILQIKKMKIKLAIINGRMTINSYNKWLRFKRSSELIFKSFDLCLTQNQESSLFYNKLGISNTYYTGNLKFSSEKFEVKEDAYNELKKIFKGRKVFLAASTHLGEEKLISDITNKIREARPEFIAIIVPRHPNRRKLLDQMPNSKVVIRSANEQVDKSTDIYLADTFGELGIFYKLADFIFIGGSFVPHGGQNPIEAAYFCNNIFHGRHVENFLEVYEALGHLSITEPVDNSRQLQVKIMKCYDAPPSDEDELMRKINLEASDVLKDTMHHLNSNILNNDI
jgi:3-deoxy-D-manno-octulosonic-acid transferase